MYVCMYVCMYLCMLVYTCIYMLLLQILLRYGRHPNIIELRDVSILNVFYYLISPLCFLLPIPSLPPLPLPNFVGI